MSTHGGSAHGGRARGDSHPLSDNQPPLARRNTLDEAAACTAPNATVRRVDRGAQDKQAERRPLPPRRTDQPGSEMGLTMSAYASRRLIAPSTMMTA